MNILYVEDDPRDADLTRREFARSVPHFRLDTAATQREALARLEGEPPYDLVLTDLRLPDGDGLAVLAHVRERGLELAVVVITGGGDEESAVAALKAGANDYVVKGGDYLARLPLALENALHRFRAEADRRTHPLHVLYAEHHATDVDLTRRHLARHAPHIHLEVVHSAPEVFQRLSEKDRCDLLLLDYHLPGMNALEVLKELAQVHRLDLPVVLVTGRGDEEVAVQALRLGAADYLVKNPGYLYRLPPVLENAFHRVQLTREQAALRESEEHYRTLFDGVPTGLNRTTPAGQIIDANLALVEMMGYPDREMLLATNVADTYADAEDRKQWLALMEDEGVVRGFETRMRRHDGAIIWVESNAHAARDADGRVLHYEGSLKDITERKQAEEELRRRQLQLSILNRLGVALAGTLELARVYRIAFEHVAQLVDCPCFGISLYDPTTRTLRAEFMLDDGELIDAARFPPLVMDAEPTRGRVRAIATRQPEIIADYPTITEEADILVVGASGDNRPVGSAMYVPMVVRGQVTGLLEMQSHRVNAYGAEETALLGPVANQIGLGIDNARLYEQALQEIAERKRAEEALREERDRAQRYLDVAGVMFVVIDAEQNVSLINRRGYQILGREEEEIVGRNWFDTYVPERLRNEVKAVFDRLMDGEVEPVEYCESSLMTRGGEERIIAWHNSLLTDDIGNAIGILSSGEDITERRRAEEELKEYSERLEEMVDERTRELRDAQEQLVRQERLAVLGQLAGGVAHELRNPLGAISNAAYFLNMVTEKPDPEVKEMLEIMEKEVRTSERIISSLLDFARPQPPIRRIVDVNEVIRETLSRAAVPDNVEVVRQLEEPLPTVLADPDQLVQVFGNIILNAVQVMTLPSAAGTPDGGTLTVRTALDRGMGGERDTGTGRQGDYLPISPSPCLRVSISDTGEGISEENMGKLFQPLFTTKAKGIGLGLALAKMLAEANGGSIEVESEVGKGSMFTVRLQIADFGLRIADLS